MSPLIIAIFGVLTVSIVTAAPVVNSNKQEALDNLDLAQADVAVERAKRADEEIFYGNEQNKPRTVAKKSGPIPIFAPSEPQGETDQGAEVIVHKEQPVTEELKDRIEAEEDDTAQEEQYKNELESSMHSILDSVLHDQTDEQTAQTSDSATEDAEVNHSESVSEQAEEETSHKAGIEDIVEEITQAEVPQEVTEVEQMPVEDQQTAEGEEEELGEISQTDDEEKDLQEMTSDGDSQEVEDEQQSEVTQTSDENEMEPNSNQRPAEYGYDWINDPTMMMYKYDNTDGSYPGAYLYPYYLARRRRSAALASLRKARHNRRIKRDLLDDSLYNFYEAPPASNSYYSPLSTNDAFNDYVPMADNEAAVMYSRLLDYIEDAIAEEEAYEDENRYDDLREEEIPIAPEFLPDEDDFQDSSYLSNSYPSPYDEGYPYGPVDFDTYNQYAKRGHGLFFPRQDEKRSFYPYKDWGAFVPEKRDHSEAIERLQRLAMALSDNSAPYYREIIDDYRRK